MLARPARRAPALTVGLIAAVLALGACDLRLETPPPAAPSPDTAEQVRERTVGDALSLAAAAQSARSGADEATGVVLDDVAAFSTAHAHELGGAYDSGLHNPTPTPTPTAPSAAPGDVLRALRADAAAALTDAEAARDGATARLLAAIAVARDQLVTRLAVALNEPPPTAGATPLPSRVPAPTAPAVPVPTSSAPALPGGLTPHDVTPLVLAHDQAGYGLEVVAAKLTGDARKTATSSAAAHRSAAEAWARRAGIANTATDPRRAAYALPADVAVPDGARLIAAGLETAVAQAASAALAGAASGGREELLRELATATAAAAGWGATPTAFPGIPNLA